MQTIFFTYFEPLQTHFLQCRCVTTVCSHLFSNTTNGLQVTGVDVKAKAAEGLAGCSTCKHQAAMCL